MGSVVGEKIARAIDYAIKNGLPFVCITKSGGARMMEAGFSLMQMAKTSAKLSLLAKAGLPYICILTDPTTGACTASFAMLGDLHLPSPMPSLVLRAHGWSKRPLERTCHAGFPDVLNSCSSTDL